MVGKADEKSWTDSSCSRKSVEMKLIKKAVKQTMYINNVPFKHL